MVIDTVVLNGVDFNLILPNGNTYNIRQAQIRNIDEFQPLMRVFMKINQTYITEIIVQTYPV